VLFDKDIENTEPEEMSLEERLWIGFLMLSDDYPPESTITPHCDIFGRGSIGEFSFLSMRGDMPRGLRDSVKAHIEHMEQRYGRPMNKYVYKDNNNGGNVVLETHAWNISKADKKFKDVFKKDVSKMPWIGCSIELSKVSKEKKGRQHK
jgi:hypothetical protein